MPFSKACITHLLHQSSSLASGRSVRMSRILCSSLVSANRFLDKKKRIHATNNKVSYLPLYSNTGKSIIRYLWKTCSVCCTWWKSIFVGPLITMSLMLSQESSLISTNSFYTLLSLGAWLPSATLHLHVVHNKLHCANDTQYASWITPFFQIVLSSALSFSY